MSQFILVCEGKDQSLDVQILDGVLAQIHKLFIKVVPGGAGPATIRTWHEDRSPGTMAIAVQDRDYQLRTAIDPLWNNSTKRSLKWRFHEIENCLLASWVIRETLQEYGRTIRQPWVQLLPTDDPVIEEILRKLAEQLLTDHVGRVLCQELRQRKIDIGKTEINVPDGIDPLTVSVTEWQIAIQDMVRQMKGTCQGIVTCPHFDETQVNSRWSEIDLIIRSPEFLASGQYRQDIKGKCLLHMLWQHIRQHCRYPGNYADFCSDLVRSFLEKYKPGTAFTVPDFEELADRIRNHMANTSLTHLQAT